MTMSVHPSRRGFTLIELLAVIVIVALTAAIASVGLVAGSEQANTFAAAAAWQDLDARARLFAVSEGPVRMTVQLGAAAISNLQTGENLGDVVLPASVSGQLSVSERPVGSIIFDARGRSSDYLIQLRERDSNKLRLRWRVCGMTGWIVQDEVLH